MELQHGKISKEYAGLISTVFESMGKRNTLCDLRKYVQSQNSERDKLVSEYYKELIPTGNQDWIEHHKNHIAEAKENLDKAKKDLAEMEKET